MNEKYECSRPNRKLAILFLLLFIWMLLVSFSAQIGLLFDISFTIRTSFILLYITSLCTYFFKFKNTFVGIEVIELTDESIQITEYNSNKTDILKSSSIYYRDIASYLYYFNNRKKYQNVYGVVVYTNKNKIRTFSCKCNGGETEVLNDKHSFIRNLHSHINNYNKTSDSPRIFINKGFLNSTVGNIICAVIIGLAIWFLVFIIFDLPQIIISAVFANISIIAVIFAVKRRALNFYNKLSQIQD